MVEHHTAGLSCKERSIFNNAASICNKVCWDAQVTGAFGAVLAQKVHVIIGKNISDRTCRLWQAHCHILP
jgi:hypothetical protein